jgi:preprotein translocase subunit SecD
MTMRRGAVRRGKAGLSGLFLLGVLAIVFVAAGAANAERIRLEVANAELAYDQRTGVPLITFKMTEASQKLFAAITTKNVGRPMAFIVDGKVLMKPVIREPILGGSGQIAGGFTATEAKIMAERIAKGLAVVEIEVLD